MALKWVCKFCGCDLRDMEKLEKMFYPTCSQQQRRDVPREQWHKMLKCKCGIPLSYFNMIRMEVKNGNP